MDKPDSILIVDDDPEIRRLLVDYLARNSFDAYAARDGREMWQALERHAIDLVVLDLMLPDTDGLTLCRDLRAKSSLPVLMLTARGEETDRIVGIEMGADDYLVKPFGSGELTARVRAQLRRSQQQQAQGTSGGTPLITFGDVVVDLTRRTVERSGELLHLTPIEYKLLTQLASQPDRVITHPQLLKLVWGPGHAEDTHYVRVHMANLRKKLERDASMPRHLVTETGVGYRFVP